MIMTALPQTLTPFKTKLWWLKELKIKLKEGELKDWMQKMKELDH